MTDPLSAAGASSRRVGPLPAALAFLFWAVVFSVVYTQAPLYYSNQNQYFLHGLAEGGRGQLNEDWLASTQDPTPLVTALIAFTYRHLPEECFYVYYILLFGVYFHAMLGIYNVISGSAPSVLARYMFIALFLAVHSALLRRLSWQLLGLDYPWYLQCGVAGQYLLGPVFQPSSFGVLLVLSVYAFLKDRPVGAVGCSALATALHATYLLGAAVLTLAYLVVLWREARRCQACRGAGLALTLAAPVLACNALTFGPTSSEAFAQAQHLLVHFRIPHHAIIGAWFDGIAVAQIIGVFLAAFLVRRNRLGIILFVASFLATALTVVQLFLDNDALALLFPWRPSVYLVPLATTVFMSQGVTALTPWLEQLAPKGKVAVGLVSGGLIALLMASGVTLSCSDRIYQSAPQEVPVLDFVRDQHERGDLYLVPFGLPTSQPQALSPLSVDFRSLTATTERRQLPFDLQRFRIYTGVPIFVDFKAIPYKDVEVLEWRARIGWHQRFYERLGTDKLGELEKEARAHGITHVIARVEQEVRCRELAEVYRDDCYKVFRWRAP